MEVAPERTRELQQRIALGRLGAPFEIWQALRFVIECEYFTGAVLEVHGGLTW
jgi:3-oxoacyl-[acyl-carrier protein] reductase